MSIPTGITKQVLTFVKTDLVVLFSKIYNSTKIERR